MHGKIFAVANVALSIRTKNLELVAEDSIPWRSLADTTLEDTFKPYFKNHEVVISLVEAEEIQELNRLYRNTNEVTDVLSFNTIGNLSSDLEKFTDLTPDPEQDAEDSSLGDIIICVSKAQAQAQQRGCKLLDEIAMLYVHGLLHLLGYDHASREEAEQMFGLQNEILAKHHFPVRIKCS